MVKGGLANWPLQLPPGRRWVLIDVNVEEVDQGTATNGERRRAGIANGQQSILTMRDRTCDNPTTQQRDDGKVRRLPRMKQATPVASGGAGCQVSGRITAGKEKGPGIAARPAIGMRSR
jgi:hypothetical protein